MAALTLQSCGEVENGHRGFKLSYGKVTTAALEENLYWYWPMWPVGGELKQMSIKEQNLEVKTEFFTGDNQAIDADLKLVWSVEPSKVPELYTSTGALAQIEVLKVNNNFLNIFKDIVGKQSIDTIIQNRDKVGSMALVELREKLLPMGIIVHTLSIADLQPSPAYRTAVEAKMVAKQEAETAKNNTVRIEEIAKQTIKAANADAEAMRIKTQALSQNRGLVEYELVQVLKEKWDGKYPTTMIGGGSAVPMFNLDKIISK